MPKRIELTCSPASVRACIVMFLLLLPVNSVKAVCDSCVTGAITASATAITSAIGAMDLQLNFQLTNIGNAIASLNTGNVALLEKLTQVNHQGFKTLTRESHELTAKVETLRVKRDINDLFGAISQDHCYERELTLGVLETTTSPYQQSLLSAKLFSHDIKSNTRSTALRRRVLEEYLPDGVDFGRFFSSTQTLSASELEHIPTLTHVLAQNTVFPVAPDKQSAKENDLSRHYRELKRERDTHGAIVEDVLTRAMLTHAPVVDAASYVANALEQAGIESSAYVQNGLTSEASLVKAMGLSNFGNAMGVHTAAISGDELTRILVGEVGKSNYLLAKQYELLKDIRYLQTLSYAKQAESFYNAKLEHAYQRLN